VGQAIDLRENGTTSIADAAEQALESVGVKISHFSRGPREGDRCIVISSRMAPQNLLRGTDWEGKSVTQVLQRIHPDASVNRLRVGGLRSQCVEIPFDYVQDEFRSEHPATSKPLDLQPDAESGREEEF